MSIFHSGSLTIRFIPGVNIRNKADMLLSVRDVLSAPPFNYSGVSLEKSLEWFSGFDIGRSVPWDYTEEHLWDQRETLTTDFERFITEQKASPGRPKRVVMCFVGTGSKPFEIRTSLTAFNIALQYHNERPEEWEAIAYIIDPLKTHIPTQASEAEGHMFTSVLAETNADLRVTSYMCMLNVFDKAGLQMVRDHMVQNYKQGPDYFFMRHVLNFTKYYSGILMATARPKESKDLTNLVALQNVYTMSMPGTVFVTEPVREYRIKGFIPKAPMVIYPGTTVEFPYMGSGIQRIDDPKALEAMTPDNFIFKLMVISGTLPHAKPMAGKRIAIMPLSDILRPLAAGERAAKKDETKNLAAGIIRSITPVLAAELDELGRPSGLVYTDFARKLSQRGFTYDAVQAFSDGHTIAQLKVIKDDLKSLLRQKVINNDRSFVLYDIGLGSVPAELSQFVSAFYDVLIGVCSEMGDDYRKWSVDIVCMDPVLTHFKNVSTYIGAAKIHDNGMVRHVSELAPRLHYIECNILNRHELIDGLAKEGIRPADYMLFRYVLYLPRAIDPREATNYPQEGVGGILSLDDIGDPGIITGALHIYLSMQNLYFLAKPDGDTRLVIEPSQYAAFSNRVPIFMPPGASQIDGPRGIGILVIDKPEAMPDSMLQFVRQVRQNALPGLYGIGPTVPCPASLEYIEDLLAERILESDI